MSTISDMQSLMNRYGIVGRNEALREALATAVLVAPTDLSVLIQGESGVSINTSLLRNRRCMVRDSCCAIRLSCC